MFERIVEDWLNKVNERSYEIPFCQLLNAEGHQVIHLSRHGPFEEGKDILSISPDGTMCAFQLKSEKVTLKVWAREIEQIIRLVEVPIIHPSINSDLPRRVFLVTTGNIDEEVRIEIDHRNRDWQRRGLPHLETIVGGQLLTRFLNIYTNLWPTELQSTKVILELYLSDGSACLDKAKFSTFLLSLLPINDGRPTKAKCKHALMNAALFAAYTLSPYYESKNHVAIIEGWIVYIACLSALVEKYELKPKYWVSILDIAEEGIHRVFEDLYAELQSRKILVEGLTLVDTPFYKGRITWVLALVSAYELWKIRADGGTHIDEWAKDFILQYRNEIQLWGEAAIPQFLAITWILKHVLSTPESDMRLGSLIEAICNVNNNLQSKGLPDPYHNLEAVITEIHKMSDEITLEETYRGRSYTLECLVELFTRRNWQKRMRSLWPKITYIEFAEFETDEPWQYCLWHCDDFGRLKVKHPQLTQSWTELRNHAETVDTSKIPRIFVDRPELLLLFIIAYPHRLTPNVGKFLDDEMNPNRRIKTVRQA